MRRQLTLVSTTAVLVAVALAAAGCGGDSVSADSSTSTPGAATTPAQSPTSTVGDTENEPTTAPAATTPAAATKVSVVMGKPDEFSLSAIPAKAKAGELTFNVENKGTILHEMVVVPSAGGAAALRQADGTATEDGAPGEVPDVEPDKGGTLTVTLPAGQYVLLCNLPGHYAGGMHAPFVVN